MVQIDTSTGFMADDIEALRDAAIDGMGIAWLPDWLLAPHFKNGSLLPVMREQRALTIETYLVRPDAPPTRRVRHTADMLVSEFAKHLGR